MPISTNYEAQAFHRAAIRMDAAARSLGSELMELDPSTQIALERLEAAQVRMHNVIRQLTGTEFHPLLLKDYRQDARSALSQVERVAEELNTLADTLNQAISESDSEGAAATEALPGEIPLAPAELRSRELEIVEHLQIGLTEAADVLRAVSESGTNNAAPSPEAAQRKLEVAPPSAQGVAMRVRDFFAAPIRLVRGALTLVGVGIMSTYKNMLQAYSGHSLRRTIVGITIVATGSFGLAVGAAVAVSVKFLFYDLWKPLFPNWVVKVPSDEGSQPARQSGIGQIGRNVVGAFSAENGHLITEEVQEDGSKRRIELTTRAETEHGWITGMWQWWDGRMAAFCDWLGPSDDQPWRVNLER